VNPEKGNWEINFFGGIVCQRQVEVWEGRSEGDQREGAHKKKGAGIKLVKQGRKEKRRKAEGLKIF